MSITKLRQKVKEHQERVGKKVCCLIGTFSLEFLLELIWKSCLN